MKILIHDYAGHPFQVHLSRHLARRGHTVTHMYFVDNHGPKGSFVRQENDSDSLSFHGVTLGKPVKQTALIRRRFGDVRYGQMVARWIYRECPQVVLCGNTPVESQTAIIKACKYTNAQFVYWVQDVYGVAMKNLLEKQLGLIGSLAGRYFQWMDHRQFRDSDAIVAITEGFVPEIAPWTQANISIIENWASLEEIPVRAKYNAWAHAHELKHKFTFLYSGTLGRKHNPMLLLKLAKTCGTDQVMAVVGQGVGQQRLEAIEKKPESLRLLPLQPVEQLADVLATADVLVATIEADAGQFAVPSKIQSYLCAGRPILLAAPKINLAARTVERANAGIVVAPGDEAGFLAAAQQLAEDGELRARLGANGRAYAERTFDLGRIADRFERVLTGAVTATEPRPEAQLPELAMADGGNN